MKAGASVTEAIYDAGYGSSSRFYETLAPKLGLKPGAYARGGEGEVIRFAVGECSLGSILVAATEKGVCAIELGDDAQGLVDGLQQRFRNATLVGGDAGFEEIVAAAVGLVEDPSRGLGLPLHVRGTAFQLKVWEALRGIGPGRTATYKEVAAKAGVPGAVRAVGTRYRQQQDRGGDPLSPRDLHGRRAIGLSLGRGPQGRAAGARAVFVSARRGYAENARLAIPTTRITPHPVLLPNGRRRRPLDGCDLASLSHRRGLG